MRRPAEQDAVLRRPGRARRAGPARRRRCAPTGSATCPAHPAFARLVERGLYLLGAMGEADLRAAIEGPARQAGLLLEPGLVDLLVREVEGEPGALPLLSHALRQTWERREGRTLTVAGYRATGGIRGAVAQSAEAVYERVAAEQRPLLRDLLLRLVDPERRRRAGPRPGAAPQRWRPTPSTSGSSSCSSPPGWSPATATSSSSPTRRWPAPGRGCAAGSTTTSKASASAPPRRRRRRLGPDGPPGQRAVPRRPPHPGARLARPGRRRPHPDRADFLDAVGATPTPRSVGRASGAPDRQTASCAARRAVRSAWSSPSSPGCWRSARAIAPTQSRTSPRPGASPPKRWSSGRIRPRPPARCRGRGPVGQPGDRGNVLTTIERSPRATGVIRSGGPRLIDLEVSPDGPRAMVVDHRVDITLYDLSPAGQSPTCCERHRVLRAPAFSPDGETRRCLLVPHSCAGTASGVRVQRSSCSTPADLRPSVSATRALAHRAVGYRVLAVG